MSSIKICIVGLGNMGKAIYDILSAQKNFQISGCEKEDDANERLKDSDIVLLAIKPQTFEEFCKSLSIDVSDKLIISIMAGMKIERIKNNLNAEKIVRVMPNLPLKYGAGFSAWTSSKGVSKEEKETVRDLFESMGTEIHVKDEDQIDKITALSGCGPAYFFLLNKALEQKALDMGFSHEEAAKIADSTFLGAAKLFKKESQSSDAMIKKIASKGGTTEAALKYFNDKEFEKIVADAVESAYKRAKEL